MADTYNFRLDQHPSSYYVSRFRPQDIRIASDEAWVTIEAGADGPADLGFTIRFSVTGGVVSNEQLEWSMEVLANIAELDAEVRHVWDDPDDDGWSLIGLEVSGNHVRLHYAAGAFNSELNFDVQRRGDGSWGLVPWA